MHLIDSSSSPAMLIKDSKTTLLIIATEDTPMHEDMIPPSQGIYNKRSSAPDRFDMFDANPFCKEETNHDLKPTVPIRRFSKHNSEAAKDILGMRASFLSELLLLEESIQDDFDDDSIIMESSVISDITNPTAFLSDGRTESMFSIDTYSSEAYTEPAEYHRLSSSSGSRDLPPRPAARELTADFEPSDEDAATSPPPMPPAPRPFAQERQISSESPKSPTSFEHDDTEDRDTPPRPFTRRLTESTWSQALPIDEEQDDSSEDESIEESAPERQQPSALTKLAIEFLQGVAIGTNYYRLKKYDDTFVGRDAVDFIVNNGFASSREDAVFLGQRLQKEFNLFHHVAWDHNLKDGNFFYRFTCVKCVSDFPRITSLELLKIAEAFQRDVKVSSHFHHFMTYKRTFVGSQAVDYLVDSGLANCRNHAVFLGQRLLEDLNLFHHVAHAHQFKDANLFYRFSRRSESDSSSTTSDDASSASVGSLLVAFQRRSIGCHDMKPLQISASSLRQAPSRSSLRMAGSSELKQEGRSVTFGSVDERVFERTLEMHPATRSGPSIGLGWSYEDKPSVPLIDESTERTSRNKKDFLLSSNTRKNLLCEWGHSKIEMFWASRVNEKIREQRKRSLNKITAKNFDTEAMPSRSSPFPSFR